MCLWSLVVQWLTAYRNIRTDMAVEVDHAHFAPAVVRGSESRQGRGVVAAQGHDSRKRRVRGIGRSPRDELSELSGLPYRFVRSGSRTLWDLSSCFSASVLS